MIRPASLLLACVLLAAPALASGGKVLALERAWARATPPGSTVAAVYLVIDNRSSRSDRLLAVSSPRAGSVEVHATERDVDLVRMRRISVLHVGAGERLELAPGGTHLMLLGLKAPLREGEKLPLTLRFEVSGELKVEARVLAASATEPAAGHDHHH